MTGVFAADVQQSRTAFVLAEPGDSTIIQRITDGERYRIPSVAAGDLWGSAAARERLRHDVPGAPDRGDPSDTGHWPGLLRGLHGRASEYLGYSSPRSAGYDLALVDPAPHRALSAKTLADSSEAAGWAPPERVSPWDALLVQWLSYRPEMEGPAVVVACGERWTCIAGYLLERRQRGWPLCRVPLTAPEIVVVESGGGTVDALVARWILDRCREDTPAEARLELADGVDEFADMMRGSSPDQTISYHSALSERLVAPVRLARPEVARWPAVVAATEPTATAAARLAEALRVGAAAVPIVVGGPGADWPFLGDLLAGHGHPVWASPEPSFDLAAGAALWCFRQPEWRSLVRDGRPPLPQTRRSRATPDPTAVAPASAAEAPSAARDLVAEDSMPTPWERRRRQLEPDGPESAEELP